MRKHLCLLLFCLACGSAVAATASKSAAPQPATGTVEALFSPWDDVEGAIIQALQGARHSIHVQAYLLTSRSISTALIAAHERGVNVRVLADAEMALKGESSKVGTLVAAGIPVWLEVRYVNAHNKILLIDASTHHPVVITGSYNYTWSAQARNAENLLILRDNPALAAQYLANWQRHQGDAQPYPKDTEK